MLIASLLVLVLFIFVIIAWRLSMCGCGSGCYGQCETTVETVTTTTTHGHLTCQFDNGQPYVIDPADGKKIWLNSTDDMYEDANGEIWVLV